MAAIEHVALWVSDLERERAFFERYFGAMAGNLYVNGRCRRLLGP